MVGEPFGSPLTDDVEIGDNEQLLVEPEKLPDPSLHAVAHHSISYFSADGDTQSCITAPPRLPQYNEMGGFEFIS